MSNPSRLGLSPAPTKPTELFPHPMGIIEGSIWYHIPYALVVHLAVFRIPLPFLVHQPNSQRPSYVGSSSLSKVRGKIRSTLHVLLQLPGGAAQLAAQPPGLWTPNYPPRLWMNWIELVYHGLSSYPRTSPSCLGKIRDG